MGVARGGVTMARLRGTVTDAAATVTNAAETVADAESEAERRRRGASRG